MGTEVFQRDLDKLEGWTITKYMKFNKLTTPGMGNLRYMYILKDKRLESSHKERDLGGLIND